MYILFWEEETDGKLLISALNLFFLFREISWKLIAFKVRSIALFKLLPAQILFTLISLSSFSQSTLLTISSVFPDAVCLYLYSMIHLPGIVILVSSTLFVKLIFLQVHDDPILFLELHRLNLLLSRSLSCNCLWQYEVKSLPCLI